MDTYKFTQNLKDLLRNYYQIIDFKINKIMYKMYVITYQHSFSLLFVRQYNKAVLEEQLIFNFSKNSTIEHINETIGKVTFCSLHQANHIMPFCHFEVITSQEVECPICMDNFEEHTLKLTACNHKVCYKCFYKLTTDKCPMCRGLMY